MFDWNDLKFFLAVARHGSTIAGSKALRTSQSTVHRRVGALERQLNCKLVRRHQTGYRLTELGEQLQTYALAVEVAATAFERRSNASDRGLGGTVRITCPEAFGSRLVRSRLIEKFNARYPNLTVEMVMSDRLLDLSKGEADIAFRAAVPTNRALFGRKIARSPWAIYASADYVQRYGGIASAKEIERHSVVRFDGDMRSHPAARWLQSVAPRAKVSARGSGLPAVLMAVKSGAGIGVLPAIVGETEKDLARLFGPLSELPTDFYMFMHEDMKRTPRVRTLFNFMAGELPALRSILTPAFELKKAQLVVPARTRKRTRPAGRRGAP